MACNTLGKRLLAGFYAGVALEGLRILLVEPRGEASWNPTEGLTERAGGSPLERLLAAGFKGAALEGLRILVEPRGGASWDLAGGLIERAGRSSFFDPQVEMNRTPRLIGRAGRNPF